MIRYCMRAIAWLLMSANSHPLYPAKDDFYQLKRQLLQAFGEPVGVEIQHISKKCWSCNGTGWWREGVSCWDCVDGIYREFWVKLHVWSWHGYEFHLPGDRRPHPFFDADRNLLPVTIHGYIKHEVHWASHEAVLWLMMLFRPQTWWYLSTTPAFVSDRCPDYLPLTTLQRLLSAIAASWRRCRWRWRQANANWPLPNPDDEVPF